MNYPRLSRRAAAHYANEGETFHLVFNAHPKFGSWPEELREIIWDAVMEQRTAGRISLFAACLMPDHLHLLVGPGDMDLVKFVTAWKTHTTRQSWQLGNRNALWQPRYWDRTIRSDVDFAEVSDYILRNPVTAGLVGDEKSWQHSWASWWDA